jgi:alginate O-acetyltransferase complex protein AlgI
MLEELFSFLHGGEFALGFTQLDFWIFFLAVMVIFSMLHKSTLMKTIFLTALSLFFYFKTSGASVVILSFSILLNYFSGKIIHKLVLNWQKKSVLIFAVTVNLLILAYLKYAYFFTESFNEMFHTKYEALNYFAHWTSGFTGEGSLMDKIIIPAGVSFFTFQSISYIVDIYRKEVAPVRNFFEYSFFITFFPHVLLGPIARAKDFIPQINKPYHLDKSSFSWAVFQIMKGLVKKLVLADYIATHFVDKIVDSPESYPGFLGIIAMWAYSLQIYADFSGYTDIATGVARLMGFELYQNFNSPYKATSVGDFWRRWHRSLGNWLKTYLYIPLGGNKTGGIGTYASTIIIFIFLIFITQWYDLIYIFLIITAIYVVGIYYFEGFKRLVHRDLNLLITMIVGGLWHGASQNFVMWGAMNGVALVVYNYWKKISPYENSTNGLSHFWKIFITFNFITFTRIWFIMEDNAAPFEFLSNIWNQFNLSIETFGKALVTYQTVFILLVVGYITHWLPNKVKDGFLTLFTKTPMALQMISIATAIFFIYQAVSEESKGFVYFQF